MKKIEWLKFPLVVKWYITSKCNLRCSHCYLTDYTFQGHQKKIFETIDYLGNNGVKIISLLGGEPLIRRDLEDIVERIRQAGIHLNVSTNGTLVTRNRAKRLVEAGLRDFQVSIDGPNATTNDATRGKGSFDGAIRGMKLLKEAGAKVTVGYVINRDNLSCISEMVRLCNQNNVDVLRFEAFVPVGTGKLNQDSLLLKDSDVLRFKQALKLEREKLIENESRMRISAPFDFQSSSCQGCSTFGCGAGTTTLIINSDFTIAACDMLVESDATDKPFQSVDEISNLWRNHQLFRKWRGQESTKKFDGKLFSEVHQHGCHLAVGTYGSKFFSK